MVDLLKFLFAITIDVAKTWNNTCFYERAAVYKKMFGLYSSATSLIMFFMFFVFFILIED